MHAESLLHKWLFDVLPKMHPKRRKALGAVVSGAFRGGRLTVTSLGRSIESSAKEKHNIKRADRLLSNERLQSESLEIYTSVSSRLIGSTSQPIILIDWSDIDARREFFLLRAATPVKGRSLTVYEEVHSRETKEKRITHKAFLQKLKEILPKGCKPVIVTDAGFRTPWFRQVQALGWDFVGRVRNREQVKLAENKPWIGAKSLYPQASGKAKQLHQALLTRSNSLDCSLVLFKSKPKGRVRVGKMGEKSRSRTSLVSSARAREPWLLASSLTINAKHVVKLYATRMQIEESFRDLKCPRYGLSLYQNGTYKIQRLKVLVLIGSLTATFAWLLGQATKLAGKHRQFQANTVSHTNVLSTVFIGIQVFRDWRMRLSVKQFSSAKKQLTLIVKKYAHHAKI